MPIDHSYYQIPRGVELSFNITIIRYKTKKSKHDIFSLFKWMGIKILDMNEIHPLDNKSKI